MRNLKNSKIPHTARLLAFAAAHGKNNISFNPRSANPPHWKDGYIRPARNTEYAGYPELDTRRIFIRKKGRYRKKEARRKKRDVNSSQARTKDTARW